MPNLNSKLTPDCNLDFKLSINPVGTISNPQPGCINDINPAATVQCGLELCCDIVNFENIPCPKNLNRLILCVPLMYLDSCHLYTIQVPPILNDELSTVTYSDNIIVKGCETNEILPIGLQVANGYLYVVIDITDQITVVIEPDETCTKSLKLCFDRFCFNLCKKLRNCACDLKCKSVIWQYGFVCPPSTTASGLG